MTQITDISDKKGIAPQKLQSLKDKKITPNTYIQ